MPEGVSGNDIGPNIAHGIDLSASAGVEDGFTANDPEDADIGGNDLQNFPVLTSMQASGGALKLSGTLDVPAATSDAIYTISVHESSVCFSDPEGEWFLGAAVVVLSGDSEEFAISVPPAGPDPLITVTATDPAGNTSEFSPCFEGLPGLVFADGFE